MWGRLSLKVKLTTLVVTIITVASLSFAKFTVNGLLGMLTKAAGQGVQTAAESMAMMVDGAWLQTFEPANKSNPEYQLLLTRVSKLLKIGYTHRVDIVRFVGAQEVEHVLNLPADSSPDHYPPGVREAIQPGSLYNERKAGYDGIELSQPGAFIAGWAPIMQEGRQVGLVFVIMDGSETQEFIDTITVTITIALLIFILLAGLLGYKFSATFEKTAVTDGLMGIYNHKYFKQRLEEEVAKSRRYKQQTSLVFLDLDFFKRVNDTYGHATGDIVLKQLAKWVTECCRTTDVVCRYGGEEVAVILTHTGLAGAQEFAERLRLKIAQQTVSDPEEKAEFRVTVSIGVTQWEQGLNMIDMIKRADAALYHSKNTGRNRVTIYQEDLLPTLTEPPKKGGT